MSDNTREAPERIWVDYWLTGKKPRQVTEEDLGGCTEYVRADRIEELEAKLEKAVARPEVAEATIASVSDDALDKAIDASRALIAKKKDRTDDQWRRG